MEATLDDGVAGPACPLSTDEFGRRLWAAGPLVRDRLRAAMSRRLARLADGDDIWQDTCVMAWRQRAQFHWQGRGAFVRWLLTIALRAVHRQARQQTRRGLEFALDDQTLELLPAGADAPEGDPRRLAELRDEAAAVHLHIAALPTAQREVFLLSLDRRLSAAAVGRILAKSVGTVHKHRYRALRTLRRACAGRVSAP